MRNSKNETRAICAIDVGTSKILCLIAAPDAQGELQLLGLGHQRSQGLKSGMIVEPDEAARAVRAAVGQAERMAGTTAEQATVSIVSGRIRSQNFVARAPLAAGCVGEPDPGRLLFAGRAYVERGGRALIQLSRSDWQLDGQGGVRDPRGMAGRELSLEMNAVTADEGPMLNLTSVIERCHLEIERMAAAPFASALAVTTEEERRLGVMVVDLGAGATSIAAFADDKLIAVDAIPVGGHHLTFDLARGLVTSIVEAERIKTLFGTLIKAQSDAFEIISFAGAGPGEDERTASDGAQMGMFQTSKADVADLLLPRIAHLIDLIEERARTSGFAELMRGPVVLTGGGSQLIGLEQVWSDRIGGAARVGRPRPLGRMPQAMCNPAFSTVIGLALADRVIDGVLGDVLGSGGYLGRVQQWIRESF